MKNKAIIEAMREDNDIIAQLRDAFPEATVVEINSFDMVETIQFVLPLATIIASLSATIIPKLIDLKKIRIKVGDIEIEGTSKDVAKWLPELVKNDQE